MGQIRSGRVEKKLESEIIGTSSARKKRFRNSFVNISNWQTVYVCGGNEKLDEITKEDIRKIDKCKMQIAYKPNTTRDRIEIFYGMLTSESTPQKN